MKIGDIVRFKSQEWIKNNCDKTFGTLWAKNIVRDTARTFDRYLYETLKNRKLRIRRYSPTDLWTEVEIIGEEITFISENRICIPAKLLKRVN